MTTTTFVWDKDYKNLDQVRPYFADFMAIYNAITGTKYNDLFKGKIPGLIGSPNEDTGIYLLQNLAGVEEVNARIAAFLADGGYRLTEQMPGPKERGTLVHFGYYMGGTGWSKQEHVIVACVDNMIRFKAPRQRNWRTHHNGPSSYLFMPDNKES